MRWPWHRKQVQSEPFPGMPLCFVDREGKRYTTAVAGGESDWWFGATILMPHHPKWLRAEGKLPLIEVNPYTGEPLEPDATRSESTPQRERMAG